MICRNCQSSNEDDAVYCTKCGMSTNDKLNKPLKMKWFKFNIYFYLILLFFSNLIIAYKFLRGEVYFSGTVNVSQQVYRLSPLLRSVDIIFAIACIAMAVFSINVRQKLAKYRLNAPKRYMFLVTVNLLILVAYQGVRFYVFDIDNYITFVVVAVIQIVVFLLLNNSYFKKRKHLFVN